jgi:uncharacterized membrane protein YeaQ/YmgE (transglycosylase-associated protein family)
MRNAKKSVLFALLAGGTMFQGCLGGWFNWMIQGIPGTVVAEWLLDNDGVFDLFPDGGTAQ